MTSAIKSPRSLSFLEDIVPLGMNNMVLVLSGALNPVHRMHIQLLVEAKHVLETEYKRTVIAGVLSPSSDDYVYSKLGNDAMWHEDRVAMAKLAVTDAKEPGIHVCDWGIPSGPKICQRISIELGLKFMGKNFTVIEVGGADYALKSRKWQYPFVCFARMGLDRTIKKEMEKDKHRRPNKNFFLITGNRNVKELSSTEIREALAKKDVKVLEGQLHPSVLKYILG